MNLKQMLARQKELIDSARSEQRSLSDDEQNEFDELQRTIDAELNKPAVASADGQRSLGANPQEAEPEGQAGQGRDERTMGIEAERARVNDITTLCRNFGLSPDEYIKKGLPMDQVKDMVLEELKKDHGPMSVRVGDDGRDHMIDDVTDALLSRGGVEVEKRSQGAASFNGATLKDIAALCLSREEGASGRNYFMMDANEIFASVSQRQYFNPTSVFPAIMDNTVKKAYVEGHRTAPATFDVFCSKGTLSDFKKSENQYIAGRFSEMQEVTEGGEIKAGELKDEKLPSRQLKTYGLQFTLTRQAFINDDIGMITTLPARAAASARMTQNKQVYSILVNNPKVYDDKVLFGADHKNLIKTGTGVTQDAVQSMILALGGHKNNNGDAIIINPGYIVVPLGYKFAMWTLFNSNTIDQNGTANPLRQYKDDIEIVEDATINALAGTGAIPWFMIGNKAYTKFIQVDYLNGQEIPNIRRMEAAGQLGFIWDVYLDWSIAVLDYIGAVKNPGVAITSPLATA